VSLGTALLDALRELNRAMMGIVMTYKTTHETDDNVGRRSGGIGADYCSIDGSSQRGGQQRPGIAKAAMEREVRRNGANELLAASDDSFAGEDAAKFSLPRS